MLFVKIFCACLLLWVVFGRFQDALGLLVVASAAAVSAIHFIVDGIYSGALFGAGMGALAGLIGVGVGVLLAVVWQKLSGSYHRFNNDYFAPYFAMVFIAGLWVSAIVGAYFGFSCSEWPFEELLLPALLGGSWSFVGIAVLPYAMYQP